jgi:hypothetical protein
VDFYWFVGFPLPGSGISRFAESLISIGVYHFSNMDKRLKEFSQLIERRTGSKETALSSLGTLSYRISSEHV